MSFSFASRSHPSPVYFARLRHLLTQPEEALDHLLEIARTSPSMGSMEEIDAVVATVRGADPHILYGALAGVGVLVRDIPDPDVSPEQLYDAIHALAPQDTATAMADQRAFLLSLLGALLDRRDDLAIRVLRAAPAEVLRSVDSSVVLAAAVRPDDSVAGYLPVAIVRIETDSEYLVLQFDESRLADFIRDMEEIAGKVSAVRSDAEGVLRVHPPIDLGQG